MDEKEIKAIFERLRSSIGSGGEASEADKADMLRLAEGTLINLATLAAHVNRKKG